VIRLPLLALAAALAAPLPVIAQDATPRPDARAPAVTVVSARRAEIVDRLPVTGTFVPREEVLVAAEIEGLAIVEVLAEEGQRVQAGQVLARLDRRSLEVSLAQNTAQLARADAGIAQARAQIAEAEATRVQSAQSLERAQTLARTGATSAEVLDQRTAQARSAAARVDAARQALQLAEADKRLAEAQRRDIELRLSRTEVKARAAGLVSRRTARLGALAGGAGDPLFRIIAGGEIELEADVPETSLARLRAGQPASVVPVAHETPIDGRVRLVAPEINRQTRLGRVRISLGEAERVAIGTFGRATVEVARSTGVVVPLSAVLFAASGPVVQVVKEGVVETRRVQVGLRAEGLVEIREGVAEGEQVVAVSGTFLRAGDRVTAVPEPDRQARR
jgi:multidrug efflux pump subunit AcrA (membrane-fusion protein)